MNEIVHLGPWGMAAAYALLIFPLAAILWYRIPLFSRTLIAVVRMTVQLLLIGFYLHYLFEWNHALLNLAWVAVMITVADFSVVRAGGLRLRRFLLPVGGALLAGTIIPLLVFQFAVVARQDFDARYVIPIAGMILGNCLRADIIGIRHFFDSLQKEQRVFTQMLAEGATLREAVRPHLKGAIEAALSPTLATMATIGLVSLPGMMTGVILGGADPMTAILYQIAIMLAILAGTAITVTAAIWLGIRRSFTGFGLLDGEIFAK